MTDPRDENGTESSGADEGIPRAPAPVDSDTRLLGGLQGSLPAEGLISQGQTIVYHETGTARGDRDTAPSRLFAEIVARPLDLTRDLAGKPKERLRSKLAWWSAYAVLI
ncbi:hypothetical protein ACFLWA_12465, partial [Chloroflexota bacterium]